MYNRPTYRLNYDSEYTDVPYHHFKRMIPIVSVKWKIAKFILIVDFFRAAIDEDYNFANKNLSRQSIACPHNHAFGSHLPSGCKFSSASYHQPGTHC